MEVSKPLVSVFVVFEPQEKDIKRRMSHAMVRKTLQKVALCMDSITSCTYVP